MSKTEKHQTRTIRKLHQILKRIELIRGEIESKEYGTCDIDSMTRELEVLKDSFFKGQDLEEGKKE